MNINDVNSVVINNFAHFGASTESAIQRVNNYVKDNKYHNPANIVLDGISVQAHVIPIATNMDLDAEPRFETVNGVKCTVETCEKLVVVVMRDSIKTAKSHFDVYTAPDGEETYTETLYETVDVNSITDVNNWAIGRI